MNLGVGPCHGGARIWARSRWGQGSLAERASDRSRSIRAIASRRRSLVGDPRSLRVPRDRNDSFEPVTGPPGAATARRVDRQCHLGALLVEPTLGPVPTLEVYDPFVAKIEAVLEHRRMLVAIRTLALHHVQVQIAKLPTEIRDQLCATGKIDPPLRRLEGLDLKSVSTLAGTYRLSWLTAFTDVATSSGPATAKAGLTRTWRVAVGPAAEQISVVEYTAGGVVGGLSGKRRVKVAGL